MSPKAITNGIIQVFLWIVLFAIVAYSVYTVESSTGVGGWLIDLQVRHFGDAYPFFSIMALFVVLYIGAILLLKLCDAVKGKSADRSISDRLAALDARQNDGSVAFLSVGIAMIICGAIVGIGGYLYLHWKHERVRGGEFERVQLEAIPAAPMQHGKFLALDAAAQRRFTYTVTHTSRGRSRWDYYVLLTGPNWTPQVPVSYVLALTSQFTKLNLAEIETPFYVEAERNRLPEFLLSYYRKAGITLTTPYYAVTPMPVENGRVGTREWDETACLIVGGIFAAMGLLFAGIGYRAYRKQAARA